MSVRSFLKALFSGDAADPKPKHAGHDLADTIDEAMGPQAGSAHGRMAGGGVYRYFEDGTDETTDTPR